MKCGFIIVLIIWTFSVKADSGIEFFEKKIRPVLQKYCYECHSVESGKTKGGLLVDSKIGLLSGGESGPAIVAKDLDKSILWKSINYQNDMEMPPKKKLPESVIADFKTWILMGAPDPRDQKKIIVKSKVTTDDIAKGKEFWSFKIPQITPTKDSPNELWKVTEIDKYIFEKLSEKKLTPPIQADAVTVIRRVYFDLIGLPPTPEEVVDFTEQYNKNAEKAVNLLADKLLSIPQFGERWGRHWLDAARYAESSGRELNASYPYAWRYRDYVIKAFNDDKPYDQFIQEQIAGDLLKAPTDEKWAENLVATGFLAIGPKTLMEDDGRQFTADVIDEQIDVTSRAILGLSIACARCHDHKFDPIPQSDYYALAGIFLSSKTYYGTLDFRLNRHVTSLITLPINDEKPLISAIPKSEINNLKSQLAAEEVKKSELIKDRLNRNINDEILQIDRRMSILREKLKLHDDEGNPVAYCMGMQPGKVQNAPILEKGEVDKPGQTVERGFVQVLGNTKTISSNSNGRKELAEWLTSKQNPLAARVMVNRVWSKLMGDPLVRTPDNFGFTGMAPKNQELLDYLAVQFMQKNWSVKSLIKQIIISQIYRSSSAYNAINFKKDPENHYLWRVSPRRLEAEVLRDSILQISGQLDLTHVENSLVATQGHTIVGSRSGNGKEYYDKGQTHRSVYLPILRDQLPEFMEVFDYSDSMVTVLEREQNDTPQQALYLLNNNFILVHSDKLAKKIIEKIDGVDGQIKEAFAQCFSRAPSSKELAAAISLYSSFLNSRDLNGKKKETKEFVALSAICQSLFSVTEFRYRK